MDDHAALLKAILLQPDENTPRLMIADWYEEHDDPDRAEFIRDQIEWRVGSRDFDLLNDNWDRWFPNVIRHDENGFSRHITGYGGIRVPLLNGNAVVFSRGFVHGVWFSRFASYLEHVERGYWGNQPVTEVRLIDAVVYPSGGNGTYYVGGLGRFPKEYWHRLEDLPSHRAALDAISAVAVDHGRSRAGLPPLNSRSSASQIPAPWSG
jgi:uncharacterized protein (TIGR02996 family)